jgi:hypothetical protein
MTALYRFGLDFPKLAGHFAGSDVSVRYDPLRIYGIETSRRNVGRLHVHHVGQRRLGAQHV